MILPESFTTGTVTEKLQPSWKELKSYLKHKQKDMTFKDLTVKLRIESRVQERQIGQGPQPNDDQSVGAGQSLQQTVSPKCKWTRAEVNNLQGRLKATATAVTNLATTPRTATSRSRSRLLTSLKSTSMLRTKVTLLLWSLKKSTLLIIKVASMSTLSLYANINKFVSYRNIEGRKINMGNQASSEVIGIGDVIFMITLGVSITLKEVLHVPNIRQNLVFRINTSE